MAGKFPLPSEIVAPAGAEGWQELYNYSSSFSADRAEYEDSMFWFQDGVHWPKALLPWDASLMEMAIVSLSQYNSRHLLVPPANGIDFRILNGYVYLSPVPAPEEDIPMRAEQFMQRAGHYFLNWNELYDNWLVKIRDLVKEMELLEFSSLPDVEPLEVVTSGAGVGSGGAIQANYLKLLSCASTLWQYHFEFLNLGYAAYLDFFGFCKQAFPGISDLAIAKMVAGVEVDLFRPDEELKRLARMAVDTGITDAFKTGDVAGTCQALRAAGEYGEAWISSFQQSAEPWFNFSTGSGFSSQDKIWIENVEIPFDFIKNYIDSLQAGGDINRPTEAIAAERDRIVAEYMTFLASDEDREAFNGKLGLARVVFPYVENHNFYVEHWSHSVIWRKMKELGAVFAKEGFLDAPEDIFYLRRHEVPDALFDLYHSWAAPAPARGPHYWPPIVARRKGIVEALNTWKPSPALGVPPEVVTEPFTIMLWGITSDSIANWLGGGASEDGTLNGMAASPGVEEGPARVIFGPDQINEVLDGEILVAPLTAPSWAPIFGKIKATVTDTGGMMSHAAIVCREYGLPAVTGTGFATSTIKTGQRIRVDGSNGKVTILD
ncbi:MAG TPA: PEP-utilizing enzyme [Candidatus Nanopelagicales bacterium]